MSIAEVRKVETFPEKWTWIGWGAPQWQNKSSVGAIPSSRREICAGRLETIEAFCGGNALWTGFEKIDVGCVQEDAPYVRFTRCL